MMRALPLKSQEVCRLLGKTYGQLTSALRQGKVQPLPEKDASGDLIFWPEDVERVRQALSIDRRKLARKTTEGTSNV